MRTRIRKPLVVVLATLALSPAAGEASSRVSWKGAESLTPLALVPNLDRCGPPPITEARFAGDGIDDAGGVYAVTVSGCLDPNTLRVFDLEATDTYANGSGSVDIAPADATLVLDEDTCVATNAKAVPFDVAGGSGEFANAAGSGTYHIAFSWPPCGGPAAPARVWFSGRLVQSG